MSDLIFKTDGKETHRISFPNLGTKCPETKLEIKMTEKFTLELTLDELHMLDKYVEYCEETKEFYDKLKDAYPKQKSPVEEAYKDWCGEYPTGGPSEDAKWGAFLAGYQVTQPKAVPVDEPDWYDEVEWDEKDNPKPMDEVVNRLVKKYEAQKLFNRLVDELGYDFDACNDVVDLVESWLPEPQSAAGSQNVDTELLVDGFNHCLQKMKEMLR